MSGWKPSLERRRRHLRARFRWWLSWLSWRLRRLGIRRDATWRGPDSPPQVTLWLGRRFGVAWTCRGKHPVKRYACHDLMGYARTEREAAQVTLAWARGTGHDNPGVTMVEFIPGIGWVSDFHWYE